MWSIVALTAILAAPTVDQLGWIAGHWSMEKGNRTIEEHWTKPAGGTMIGMGRTVAGAKTVEFEFLRIKQEDGEIFYVAQPNGNPPTNFKLVRSSDSEAVFENLQHDFPQRVIYRKAADGTVTARIEGDVKGETKAIDFAYKRAKCDGT